MQSQNGAPAMGGKRTLGIRLGTYRQVASVLGGLPSSAKVAFKLGERKAANNPSPSTA